MTILNDTQEIQFQSGNSEESEGGRSVHKLIHKAADYMANIVTHHETNNTALSSVIEVKLETTIIHSHSGVYLPKQ